MAHTEENTMVDSLKNVAAGAGGMKEFRV